MRDFFKNILGSCNEILWSTGNPVTKLEVNEEAAKILEIDATLTFNVEDKEKVKDGDCIGKVAHIPVYLSTTASDDEAITYFTKEGKVASTRLLETVNLPKRRELALRILTQVDFVKALYSKNITKIAVNLPALEVLQESLDDMNPLSTQLGSTDSTDYPIGHIRGIEVYFMPNTSTELGVTFYADDKKETYMEFNKEIYS